MECPATAPQSCDRRSPRRGPPERFQECEEVGRWSAIRNSLYGLSRAHRFDEASEGLEVAQSYQFLDGYGLEIEDITRSPVIEFTWKNPQVQEGKLVTVIWLILIWLMMGNHLVF